jgi:hypothetical protein
LYNDNPSSSALRADLRFVNSGMSGLVTFFVCASANVMKRHGLTCALALKNQSIRRIIFVRLFYQNTSHRFVLPKNPALSKIFIAF